MLYHVMVVVNKECPEEEADLATDGVCARERERERERDFVLVLYEKLIFFILLIISTYMDAKLRMLDTGCFCYQIMN